MKVWVILAKDPKGHFGVRPTLATHEYPTDTSIREQMEAAGLDGEDWEVHGPWEVEEHQFLPGP